MHFYYTKLNREFVYGHKQILYFFMCKKECNKNEIKVEKALKKAEKFAKQKSNKKISQKQILQKKPKSNKNVKNI